MTSFGFRVTLRAFLLGALAFSPPVLAQTNPVFTDNDKALASELLTTHWEPGYASRKAAETLWLEKVSSVPADGIATAAYALNRIQHGQFREAREASMKLAETFKGDLHVWYMRIWAEMAAGNRNEALLLMQKVKNQISAGPEPDAATRFDIYSGLGRLIAFAEGPSREKVRPTTLAETIAVVTEGLKEEDSKAFDAGRQETTNMYVGLVNEVQGNIEAQLQQSAEKNAAEKVRIEQENASIAGQQEQLRQQMSAVREQQAIELSALDAQAAPLRDELGSLNMRLSSENQRTAIIIADINHLEYLAANELDPFIRDSLLAQASAARIALASQQSLVLQLAGQRNSTLSALNSVESQMAAAQSRFSSELRSLNSEDRRLSGTLKRNSRLMSGLGDPSTAPGYVKRTSAELALLATYDPFPVDEMRHHFLEMVR